MPPTIKPIDLHFLGRKRAIAAYAVADSRGYTLVECGPHSTTEALLAGLNEAGIDPGRIHSLLLTHIHFDHAGAAWWWARRGTRVYVHPRGYRHLIDPERLYNSARMIYGDRMKELWGEMNGITEDRVEQVADRQRLSIGENEWVAHHTPGHAKHHIAWQLNDVVFTGDVGGCRIDDGPAIPPCPPPDIDPADWKESIQRLRDSGASRFFLTHYGEITDPDAHLTDLETRLDRYLSWIEPYYRNGTARETIVPLFQEYVTDELRESGVNEQSLQAYLAANPPGMSVAGLLRALRQRDEA